MARSRFPLHDQPLALALVNTLVSDRPGRDLLTTPEDLREWLPLQAARLPDPGQVDLQPLRDARALLRQLFEDRAGGRELDPAQVDALNALAASAPLVRQLVRGPSGWLLETQRRTDSDDTRLLATVAASAIEVLADVDPARLRRCAGPGCRLLFTAAHPARRWCDSRTCGNRVRVARHSRSRPTGG